MAKKTSKRLKMIAWIGVILGVSVLTGSMWGRALHDTGQKASTGGVWNFANIEPAAGDVVQSQSQNTVNVQNSTSVKTLIKFNGNFDLVDHNGADVTQDSYDGYYRLVFFGFTHCPMICPVELKKMDVVLRELGELAKEIQPIFITTDPGRDTPNVIKTYISSFHPSLVGLTGSEKQLKDVQKAYKVYAEKAIDPELSEYTMEHSAYMYLMDRNNELITVFGQSDTPEDIATEIKSVLY